MAALHNCQIVVLEVADWRAWLAAERPEGEVLRPSAAGVFAVRLDVDDGAAEATPRLL